jgi:aminopeptidase 2
LKATFEVEITADKDLAVLSNMDVNTEHISGDKKTTLFNTSPKMSTYVSYFLINLTIASCIHRR